MNSSKSRYVKPLNANKRARGEAIRVHLKSFCKNDIPENAVAVKTLQTLAEKHGFKTAIYLTRIDATPVEIFSLDKFYTVVSASGEVKEIECTVGAKFPVQAGDIVFRVIYHQKKLDLTIYGIIATPPHLLK